MNPRSPLPAKEVTQPLFQVLYVEDQPTVAAVILLELQRERIEVTAAPNAERALELIRQKPFDLVLIDVMLASGSGFDLHRSLKKQDHLKDLPVIFFTGVPTPQGRNEAIELGAMGYLSKASDRALLSAQIVNAVRLARAAPSSSVKQGAAPVPWLHDGRNQPLPQTTAFDSGAAR